MGCCTTYPNPYRTRQSSNAPINYEDCLKTLAAQKDVQSFLTTLCNAAGVQIPNGTNNSNGATNGETTNAVRPGVQCVVVPVAGLCQELSIFDMSTEFLNRIIKCTFSSLFSRLGPDLYHQFYSQYETFLRTGDGIDFSSFSQLFINQLNQLYGTYKKCKHDSREFYQFLISNDELDSISKITDPTQQYSQLVAYLTKRKFLEELAEEFTKTEFALCQKFLRIEIDLVILMTRITELSTATKGGISGITEALRWVAIGAGNRYFEDDDFDDIFEAAEEVADVLEKIAALYRERFEVFKEMSETLLCSRPQPPVKSVIRDIPTLPPTVII